MSLPPDPDPLSQKDMAKRLTGNPDYPYKLLKKDMIIPALNQINELTGWSLHLTEFRNGNRVAEICFLSKESSIESGNDGTLDKLDHEEVSRFRLQK